MSGLGVGKSRIPVICVLARRSQLLVAHVVLHARHPAVYMALMLTHSRA